MIKILHILSSLDGGGVGMMLYNYYMRIDRSKIKFDFAVCGFEKGMLEAALEGMGSKIFHTTPKKKSFLKNMKETASVIKNGNYHVVHSHQNFKSCFPLFLAKKYGVKIRIIHSHEFNYNMNFIEKVKLGIYRPINQNLATHFWACGEAAGRWLHGEGWSVTKGGYIMRNAIDIKKFAFSSDDREEYRQNMNLTHKKVLLYVARVSYGKNQEFLIPLMEKILQRAPNTCLLLVGTGTNDEKIKREIADRKMDNSILFLGKRRDIPQLMSAADVFVFPSKKEGLGIVAIEAQASGLRTIASCGVPKETAVTNIIKYIPLEKPQMWVDEILAKPKYSRTDFSDQIKSAGYSVDIQAEEYQNMINLYYKGY